MTRPVCVLTFVASVGCGLAVRAAAAPGERVQTPQAQEVRPSPGENMPADFVFIDGAKEPERIPEYSVWRSAFLFVARLKRDRIGSGDVRQPLLTPNEDQTIDRLMLSDRDADILEQEADRQDQRDRMCDASLYELVAKLTREGKTPDQISEGLVPSIIDCRWKDLEARDRVLAKMSADGAAAFRGWVEKQRRFITMSIPKSAMSYLMLPQ